jgi:hypothetical protein
MKSHTVRNSIIVVAIVAISFCLYGMSNRAFALEHPVAETAVPAIESPVVEAAAPTVSEIEITEAATEETTEPTEIQEITEAPAKTPETPIEAPEEKKKTEPTTKPTETPEETKHAHNYNKTKTDPTCTEGGYTTYTCECGDSYVNNKVNATGHAYESVVTAPAIGTAGYTTHTCKNCGDKYVDGYTDAIHEHVHNYVATQTFAANCTTDGHTVYACECGDSYTDDVIPATEHVYITYIVEPTYETEGYDLHICEGCGHTYKDNFVSVLQQPADPVEDEKEEPVEDDGFVHGECHCDRNDGHLHEEIRRGNYVYIYCERVDKPHKGPDGFKVWYPYDWYF